MKQIKLTQGRVAIVDDEDFEWLSEWIWFYQRSRKTGYAKRNARFKPHQMIPMQVAIMKRHKRWKQGTIVDHINMCGCDNRKENLRLATLNEQGANGGLQTNNTSKVTGVGWHKRDGRWRARITINKSQYILATSSTRKMLLPPVAKQKSNTLETTDTIQLKSVHLAPPANVPIVQPV